MASRPQNPAQSCLSVGKADRALHAWLRSVRQSGGRPLAVNITYCGQASPTTFAQSLH